MIELIYHNLGLALVKVSFIFNTTSTDFNRY
jgi:hypothetical protein